MDIFEFAAKNKMNLGKIYQPVSRELDEVEDRIKLAVEDMGFNTSDKIFGKAFNIHGRQIVPALLILSARAVNAAISGEPLSRIVRLAVVMGLVQRSSVLHDTVKSREIYNRGQSIFNRNSHARIAVLTGDILNAQAFYMAINDVSGEFIQNITRLIERVCTYEIVRVRDNNTNICGEINHNEENEKMALIMENCCRFGAELAGADEKEIISITKFGANFGMAYQSVNDFYNGGSTKVKLSGYTTVENYITQAKGSIEELNESVYKLKMIELLDYLAGFMDKSKKYLNCRGAI